MLKATTRKYVGIKDFTYYVGRVDVIKDDVKLYSHSTGINRFNKEDALLDAVWLMADLNQEVEPAYRQEMTI